jgi:hypothetical protein
MNAVEFIVELNESRALTIPAEMVDRLPKHGKARVLVLTEAAPDDAPTWQREAYAHFLRDDAPEDAIYDNLR